MSESVYERIEKGRPRLLVEAASAHTTRLIAAYFGRRIPLYCVSEYPRSGGTWLSSMMADYLRCAKPTASLFPIGCRAVVHNHWPFHKRLTRTVYLVRDGRDVMTSLYFYVMRSYKKSLSRSAIETPMDRRVRSLFGAQLDPDDVDTNLSKFLDEEFRRPFASGRVNWAQHVHSWVSRADPARVYFLSYEDLLVDTANCLRKVLEHVSVIECERRLLQRSVDHFQMSAITGRVPGDSDSSSFVRKGIVGDLKNHFNAEATEVFEHFAGDVLREAGYG